MESNLSSIECTLTSIKNTIPTLESSISIFKNTISILENALTQVKSSVSALDSSVNLLKSKKKNTEQKTQITKPINMHPLKRTRRLNNGLEMPLIGLGSSRIKNIVDVVYNSIKDGLRLIDTAFKYGNEAEIGKGLKKALDDNLCKREDLFIIGKIWIDDRKDPEAAIKETLKK